jgi:aminomethyltransferase
VNPRTPLYDWHAANGAKLVPFAGWDMPVYYTSIADEHHACRTAAGLFDIGHMGRVFFSGPGTVGFIDRVYTNRADNLAPGQVRYGLVLNEEAGALDDVLVYRLEGRHLIVVNASNRPNLVDRWFARYLTGYDCRMQDRTMESAMIAVQGPLAIGLAEAQFGLSLAGLKYYHALETTWAGEPIILSRTGYTGEDGVEAIVPNHLATRLWTELLEAGKSRGVKPVGLGARDTLRLEAGMPLYGHELNETVDPIQADLSWAVKPDAKDFVGKAALLKRDPNRPVRVGLALADKRIARENFAVLGADGRKVGVVTSGTYGPTVTTSIAMAMVEPAFKAPGTTLAVEIRGSAVPAEVVPLPFYKRPRNP